MKTHSMPRFHKPAWLIVPAVITIVMLTIMARSLNSPTTQANAFSYPFRLDLPGNRDRLKQIQAELSFYKDRVQQAPTSGLNLSALAGTYWKMGKATGEVSWYLLAEKTAQRSLSSLPFDNAGAKLTLAKIAQAQHNFKQTNKITQQILTEQPGNEEAQAILVTSHLATGNLIEADRLVTQLVKSTPTLPTLTLQALVQDARGEASTSQTFEAAIAAEEPGEIGSSAFARVMYGRHYARQGKLQKAESLYQAALEILPNYPLALVQLASLKIRQGKYEAAEQAYNQIVAYSRQEATVFDHVILRGKARIKQLQGQAFTPLLQKAETLLRQETNTGHDATSLEQGSFGHRRELALLLLDRNQPQTNAEALKLMQAEVKVRQDAQTLSALAQAQFRADRHQAAHLSIQKAIATGIADPALFMQAAQIARRLDKPQQAQRYANRATQIDPSFDQQAQRAIGLEI
ncbi:tetratricopeptide repeat protein [filamentous cyanobacterium LEGE 11480]|uniref:Tetratricopeptide repeat protein n=1 Tax=Romeriopsis navalis LEGE 11480 TaxID=2777977 RepID=A0A928Z4A7_9CYAN|nr:tetratricopeptide repeat protein [Romeriopsis navalis]MBE9031564.1 tetratricopeptide repeat protein [Romeriopsis navalis LEGE 11480]